MLNEFGAQSPRSLIDLPANSVAVISRPFAEHFLRALFATQIRAIITWRVQLAVGIWRGGISLSVHMYLVGIRLFLSVSVSMLNKDTIFAGMCLNNNCDLEDLQVSLQSRGRT